MKSLFKFVSIIVVSFALTACIGEVKKSTTETSPVEPGIPLPLRSAFYQGDLPLGNLPLGKLTLTTDTVGTTVFGAYSIMNGGTIISSGKVSGKTTIFHLTGTNNEKWEVTPTWVSGNNAEVSIARIDSSGQPVIVSSFFLTKISPDTLRTAKASIRIDIPTVVDMTITALSADNLNFLGTLSLKNELTGSGAVPMTASATVLGSSPLQLVKTGGAGVDIPFTVHNYSGHFFSPIDNLTFPDLLTSVHFNPVPDLINTTEYNYEISKFHVTINTVNNPDSTMGTLTLGQNPTDVLMPIAPYVPLP